MGFFDVVNGQTSGDQSIWNQYSDGLTGKQDADVTLFSQLTPPNAPSVSVNTSSGNLNGNYKYAIAFITGYWEGQQGVGTFHSKGNTGGGTTSATVSPNAEQVDLTNIPVGPQGVYQRAIYRTKANGSTFYLLDILEDNTSTSYTDNNADSSLVEAIPSTNTTGGKFYGDGSGLTNLPVPPSIVKKTAQEVELTGTSAQIIASFTPSENGNFQVNTYLRVVTGATNVMVEIDWTDATGAQVNTMLNSQSLSVGSHSLTPLFFNALGSNPINVKVTAGTSNQVYVSSSITQM